MEPTMTEASQYPTDEQQEAIYALGGALDGPSEADRAFFERHPERGYLVRRVHRVELRMYEIMDGGRPEKPPGFEFYYAIKRVELGRLKRLFSAAPLHHVERFSDAACRMVFEEMTEAEP
jgi:hypothetical protein